MRFCKEVKFKGTLRKNYPKKIIRNVVESESINSMMVQQYGSNFYVVMLHNIFFGVEWQIWFYCYDCVTKSVSSILSTCHQDLWYVIRNLLSIVQFIFREKKTWKSVWWLPKKALYILIKIYNNKTETHHSYSSITFFEV